MLNPVPDKVNNIVHTTNAPKSLGHYSQAIIAGKFIITAGQLGIDSRTGNFAGDTIEKQTRQSLENLKSILSHVGVTLDKVVKCTIFLVNINDANKVDKILREFFEKDPPARTLINAIMGKGSLIEIEMIAVRSE